MNSDTWAAESLEVLGKQESGIFLQWPVGRRLETANTVKIAYVY